MSKQQLKINLYEKVEIKSDSIVIYYLVKYSQKPLNHLIVHGSLELRSKALEATIIKSKFYFRQVHKSRQKYKNKSVVSVSRNMYRSLEIA